MEKQWISVALISSTLLLSGCDFFKQKKPEPVVEEVTSWSCSDQANLDQLQKIVKADYVKLLDRRLRENSYYVADQALLTTINNSLKFEIKNIRTTTQDPATATQLQCESQLLVVFPKGLLQRAENAFVEQRKDCEECENGTLRDYIESESDVRLSDNQLTGSFNYEISKTDKDGVIVNVQNHNAVIEGLATVVETAVQYASYAKENKENQEAYRKNDQANAQQQQLAQKAMNIRHKELLAEKTKQVEQLNQAWDDLSVEQRAELKQAQAEWFEKRDIDCKVLAQKDVYSLADGERETYQKHYSYWDDAMRAQNQQMQYNKCFNQRTEERSAYLTTL
ncbi:lysozyme inhibitor LprI family protein [Acinetobacter pullicarnis]|uniref:DUF1311 domain-containing protein n=1 Tax=Acinetobacter pullicarnis TaxID=2576829 RepID=UPI00112346A2|nr:DUF1311 domain-containing protein [Acinetobacter pullicarnis]